MRRSSKGPFKSELEVGARGMNEPLAWDMGVFS